MLAELLSSNPRAQVFKNLFGFNQEEVHLRELQRRCGISLGAVQKEVKKLVALDLLHKRKDGNRVCFSANRLHPIFKDIQALVLKTVGLTEIIRARLDAEKGIKSAFVFGSIARQEEDAQSDIDLMIIGSISLRKLVRALSGLSEKLGRELNPHVLTQAEFRRRVKSGEHLVTSIMSSTKLFIIGFEDELEAMGR
jgi:predicted nucleotidyltransferase